jgi:hypothetical protein
MSKVRIVMTHHGIGSIEVDGRELPGVRNILFRAGVGKENLVRVDLLADELEIDSAETKVAR